MARHVFTPPRDPPLDPQVGATDDLLEALAEEMAGRWQRGDRPRAEEYFDLHPHLWDQPEAALELVYEEIHQRQQHGPQASVEELLGRFPQWQRQVKALLECHHLLAPRLAGPCTLSAGEMLGEFRLLTELGRGAHGQVFLAAQPPLADRPVVLKLGPLTGREHISLARLQHTNIVPLHSVHDFPAQRLRVLCLPYFGGATLDRLLKSLQDRPPATRAGQNLLDALAQAPAASSAAVSSTAPCRRFLARASYVEAVAWIGACLADALQYAHERGLLHLDLKPSNVLLAADAQPMLLDFHLARAPLGAGSPAPLSLGGTPGYMAPEHEAALDAVRGRSSLPMSLDAGADIYALGVLLHELLTGRRPTAGKTLARTLRRLNPRVSAGLGDLVGRCLAASSQDRYPSAAALAIDLRRHLADLPLRGVANRSLVERWTKWRRRRRHALPILGLLLAGTLASAAGLSHVGRQANKARAALEEGQVHLDHHRYLEALEEMKHGLALVEDLPFHAELRQQLHESMRQTEQGLAAHELHLLSERLRPLYSATALAEPQARAAEAYCRTFWRRRDEILQRLEPQAGDLVRQVRSDLLDLAILGVHLRVGLAPPGHDALERRKALQVLQEAEASLGPSCVLAREREAQARALGLEEIAEAAAHQAESLAPQSAWEHCAVGLVYFRAGERQKALAEMELAAELDPGGLWPSFYRGSCLYHLQQLDEAHAAFSVCVALAPDSAWCYFNRGLVLVARGKVQQALRDYTHALQLDHTLGAALLGRAGLLCCQGCLAQAMEDLARATELGVDPAAVACEQARIHLARQEHPEARLSLRRALDHDPNNKDARALLGQLKPQR